MSVIFNEPGGGQTLSNPSQQNNVFQFVQDTKPTERSAGVALVAGDRWYNTSDGTEWFWNGTYWLGQRYVQNLTITNVAVNWITNPTWATYFAGAFPDTVDIWLESVNLVFYNNGVFQNINANNYYALKIGRLFSYNSVDTSTILAQYNTFSGVGALGDTSHAGKTQTGDYKVSIPMNNVEISSGLTRGIVTSVDTVGVVTGTTLRTDRASLVYRHISN